MIATCKGDVDIARELIAAGADVNRVDWNLGTALHHATVCGRTSVVELLIAAGANVNIQQPQDGKTALMNAALEGRAEIAKLLIQAGANMNAKDRDGKTALIIAAEVGNAEVAAVLIRSGADINATDNNGQSAFMYASIAQPEEITEPIPDVTTLQQILNKGENTLEEKFKQLDIISKTLKNVQKLGRVISPKCYVLLGLMSKTLARSELKPIASGKRSHDYEKRSHKNDSQNSTISLSQAAVFLAKTSSF